MADPQNGGRYAAKDEKTQVQWPHTWTTIFLALKLQKDSSPPASDTSDKVNTIIMY